MHTTVSLDDDVAAGVQRIARERELSFTAALNSLLRSSLAAASPTSRAYSVPTRSMGRRPSVDLDKGLRLAGEIEDDELVRKLDLRT